jgi:hypothetical protein
MRRETGGKEDERSGEQEAQGQAEVQAHGGAFRGGIPQAFAEQPRVRVQDEVGIHFRGKIGGLSRYNPFW